MSKSGLQKKNNNVQIFMIRHLNKKKKLKVLLIFEKNELY